MPKDRHIMEAHNTGEGRKTMEINTAEAYMCHKMLTYSYEIYVGLCRSYCPGDLYTMNHDIKPTPQTISGWSQCDTVQ